jgi:N-acetylmuramoyl-L-alanine amidase
MREKNMVRGGAIFSLFLCALILLISPAADSVVRGESFEILEHDLSVFKKDLKARKYRHRYKDLIVRFEKYAGQKPLSDKSAQALLYAAQLSEDVAQITKRRGDMNVAVRAYLLVVRNYSGKKVADRALSRALYIQENIIKDKRVAERMRKQFAQKGIVPQKKNESPLVNFKSTIHRISIQESNRKLHVVVAGLEKNHLSQGEIAKSEDKPRRIFFDLSPVKLGKKIPPFFEVNQAEVYKVRVGQPGADVVRLVFEVGDDVGVKITPKEKELSLEFFTEQTGAKTSELVASSQTQKTSKPVSAPTAGRPKIIVLDPGHGGDDPGAIGPRGLQEKHVTLEIAKRVKRVLEREMPGVKVYMTRDHDHTLHLSKRTEIANSLEADLFISIHANAAPNKHAQGIETYYLNISHDRYAIRLAARENAMSETEISNLEFILADLAMKSNVSDSIRLGQVVQSSIFSKVRERWDDARDLGLKHALFHVLMGVRMPAILIETSFISNKEEERRLKSDAYQHALAEGVVKGVKRYMEEQQAAYVP